MSNTFGSFLIYIEANHAQAFPETAKLVQVLKRDWTRWRAAKEAA